MIISQVFFDKNKQEDVLTHLLNLAEPLKPLLFSADENKKNSDNKVSDIKKFNFFREKNKLGFFLYSDKATFNLSFHDVGRSSILMTLSSSIASEVLANYLKDLSEAGVEFGFVCDNSENLHRNQHFIELGMNKIYSWVGQDLSKSLSGLYWQTFISFEIAELHGVDIQKLCQVAEEYINYRNGILLRFFKQAEDWKKYAKKIDELCLYSEGVFSIKNVESTVSKDMNYIELNSALNQWK